MVTKAISDLNHFNNQTAGTSPIPSATTTHPPPTLNRTEHSRITQKQADMRERSGCLSPVASKALGACSILTAEGDDPGVAGNGWMREADFTWLPAHTSECGRHGHFPRLQHLLYPIWPRVETTPGPNHSPALARIASMFQTSIFKLQVRLLKGALSRGGLGKSLGDECNIWS